ncbi:hypothetical protein C0J52_01127 [Blattella germanica]|nr:hypothetical protein C0J52_01127 [Blattella germanica]
MAENQDTGGPLPPGWDRKYDHRTGRYYFINYFNKTTTWEDPRIRYRQLVQSSSQYAPAPVQESIPLQDLTNVRPTTIPNRALGPHINPYASPARTSETTLSTDTEQSVAKISAVFPTVSDTHIRALLMKYHNREALVMSALQVEKYPISTPGPYATPPLQGRHFYAPAIGGFSALQMTPPLGVRDSPRTGSPIPRPGSGASGSYIGSPRFGDVYRRPHSYLKSVFPKAEETLLLDILSNSDNNVQKATEKLIAMGFEKRDTPPPRLTLRRKEEEQQKAISETQPVMPTPPPRMKSLEEKQKMKSRLQEQYPDIPERVVSIALDSVDFDEERAKQILNIMIKEEEKTKPSKPSSSKERVSRGTSTTEDKEYKSPYLMKVCGPNRDLYKGPNDELLLVDYVTWNGPNADLLGNNRRATLAKGPDKSLLQERSYKAKGPNTELRKGPMRGLAKGSIYSQLTGSNSANESRGK